MTKLYTTLEFILSPMGLMHPLLFFFLLYSTPVYFSPLYSSPLFFTLLYFIFFRPALFSSTMILYSFPFCSSLLYASLLYSSFSSHLQGLIEQYTNCVLECTPFPFPKATVFSWEHDEPSDFVTTQVLGKNPKKPWLSHRIGAPDYVGLVGSVMRSQCLRHSPFDDGFES